MAFQMKSYKELLSMTKEKWNEAMIPLRVRKAKGASQVFSSNLEQDMLNLETEINELCAGEDFDFDKIISKMDSYDLKERKLKQVNELVEKLFPE